MLLMNRVNNKFHAYLSSIHVRGDSKTTKIYIKNRQKRMQQETATDFCVQNGKKEAEKRWKIRMHILFRQ